MATALKFIELTQAEYDGLIPNQYTFYKCTDTNNGYLGTREISNEDVDLSDLEAAVAAAQNTADSALSTAGSAIQSVTASSPLSASTSNNSTAISHATSGATAGTYGPTANSSPAAGSTFSVPGITVDTYGHITSASTRTITLPADNNTTYTAGTGLSLSGTTFNHSNSITAGTASGGSGTKNFGDSFTIPSISYDAQGHVTSTTTTSVTLPNEPDLSLEWEAI